MTWVQEQLVLDPAEIAASRTELALHEGPIRVRQEGPNWGDAAIAAYMAEQERGQAPVDFRMPNREVSIPLEALEVTAGDYDASKLDLQAKVARIQQEGGWLKRELRDGRKLYLDIVNATLKFGGSSSAARGSVDVDIELTLECIPDFYGDEITTLDDIVETTNPEIVSVLKQSGSTALIEGNYPGRLRLVVDEDSGNDQLGLIWGVRSRHYSSAATAALVYTAQSRTPLDAAANATVGGLACVQHANLGATWTPVLSTQAVSAGAHLTHTGTYRLMLKAYSTSGSAVRLRSLYDVGDFTNAVENAPWTFPGASNFYIADLGEVRLDPTTGTHRWQGVIQAEGTAGGENVAISRLWLVPVDEGMGKLVASVDASIGSAGYSARDEFNQAAGNLNAKTLPVGGAWATSGSATDLAVEATGHTAQRSTTADSDFRNAIAGSTTFTTIAAQVDVKRSGGAPGLGVLVRYTDASNYLRFWLSTSVTNTATALVTQAAGGVFTVIAFTSAEQLQVAAGAWYTLRLMVTATGAYRAWFYPQGAATGTPILGGQASALATGGALASGKVGFSDTNGGVVSTRNYDNFGAWVPTPDAVAFASQSAQLTTEGHFREDSTGTAYGPQSFVTGDLPRIPPSGMEGRPVELFVKGSRGDLDQLPDAGVDDISARVFYRASWLFDPSV